MHTVIIDNPSEPQVVRTSEDEVEFRYQQEEMERICRVTRPQEGTETVHDHEGQHARWTVEWATGS
ncbi:MAG: hypothetical protein IIA44_08100 [Acidobacteria bacterium]|nr:hypothetical protein [Acidobacteriota bacterium]